HRPLSGHGEALPHPFQGRLHHAPCPHRRRIRHGQERRRADHPPQRPARLGTLFLDEVSDLPLELQGRLLRALETRQLRPASEPESVPLIARLLASSARDLVQLVETGRFRKDLFYRLNVVNLRLPPLRERKEDIPLLTAGIMEQL